MSIIRAPRPDSSFYMLDKRISEDDKLSWAARGLLVYLLGKPDHWNVSVEHLRKQTEGARIQTGRDGIYALLKELIDTRYVKRGEQRRNEQGLMDSTDYIVSELPHTDKPCTDQPYTAETTLVSTDISNNRIEQRKSMSDFRFEEFWQAYPRKENKKKALEIWKRKKLVEKADVIIADVKLRSTSHKSWLEGIIPHATTYLNGSRWEDEITSPQSTHRNMVNYGNNPKNRECLTDRAARLGSEADERERAALTKQTTTYGSSPPLGAHDGDLRPPLDGGLW